MWAGCDGGRRIGAKIITQHKFVVRGNTGYISGTQFKIILASGLNMRWGLLVKTRLYGVRIKYTLGFAGKN
jgi:hypothetical protein